MKGLRQKLASGISAAIFLGFLWVLFKKVIIVTWISVPWWGALLTLVLLFFFIDTMVSRGLGAKEPLERGADRASQVGQSAKEAGRESMEAVRRKIEEFRNEP